MWPDVVVFKDKNFKGEQLRTPFCIESFGKYWNDSISSVIIIRGTWVFYENSSFNEDKHGAVVTVGPGYYSFVEDPSFGGSGMKNDTISSMAPIAAEPELTWTPCVDKPEHYVNV